MILVKLILRIEYTVTLWEKEASGGWSQRWWGSLEGDPSWWKSAVWVQCSVSFRKEWESMCVTRARSACHTKFQFKLQGPRPYCFLQGLQSKVLQMLWTSQWVPLSVYMERYFKIRESATCYCNNIRLKKQLTSQSFQISKCWLHVCQIAGVCIAINWSSWLFVSLMFVSTTLIKHQ